MFVFSTIGLPLVSLFLSLLHPQMIQATSINFQDRRTPRVIAKPSLPAIPTRPTFTFQPTRIPTIRLSSPTPLATPTLTPTPTPTNQTPSDNKQTFIMNAINNYRHSLGLSTVQTNVLTCSFAKVRAQEIANNFSHDGFNQRVANHTLPYTNYALITENIAETGNYQDVVNMWIASPGHAANMRADTPYVCVESYGNFYAYEGWKAQ